MKETLEKPVETANHPSAASGRDRSDIIYPAIERPQRDFTARNLQTLLDGGEKEVRDQVKNLLVRDDFQYPETMSDLPRFRAQTTDWMAALAESGIGRIGLPKSLGGEENLPKFIAANEALGFHDISLYIKFGVQIGLFAGSIQRLGTAYHHERYLASAADGTLLGGFAMTEIGHGSNVQALGTTAVYEPAGKEFIIHSPSFDAGKNYIGNAARDGQYVTVFAQLEVGKQNHGIHAFVVPIRDEKGHLTPGVTIKDNGLKMGLNGVDNGRIWFDHVRVPRSEMLDRFAQVTADGRYESAIKSPSARFFTMIGTLVGGRIAIGTTANSVAKCGITIAIRYAARRRQFGPGKGSAETLLLDYPAHRRRLLPLLATVYALDFAFKDLARVYGEAKPEQVRSLETLAAGLKAYSTWNNTRLLQTAREACGGEGYLSVNRLPILKADTDIFTTFEGDNTVLMQLVAKNLLAELKEELKGMKGVRLATFFLDRQLATLARRLPVQKLRQRPAFLNDATRQIDLFKLREVQLLLGGGHQLRTALRGSEDLFSAFTQLQPQLLELAEAHIERQILERFAMAVAENSDRSLDRVLTQLLNLFALSVLEKHKGWYLENGFVSGGQSRAITRAVTRLCAELREDSVELVDAFGIPDRCLAAPIAL